MKHLANPVWLLILLGLALTTTGWALKFDGYQQADACILLGTSLVLLFGVLALWKLVRWLDPGLHGPLGTIAAGVLVLLLEVLRLAANGAEGLALMGSLLAMAGTGWLLVRLNRAWDRTAAERRHNYLSRRPG